MKAYIPSTLWLGIYAFFFFAYAGYGLLFITKAPE